MCPKREDDMVLIEIKKTNKQTILMSQMLENLETLSAVMFPSDCKQGDLTCTSSTCSVANDCKGCIYSSLK